MEQSSVRKTELRDNTTVFRIAFVIDLILCQIGYISVPAIVAAVFIFFWGLSLFVRKYIYSFNIKNVNYYGWLTAFIVSNVITLLVQGYDRGFWESLGMILNMPLIFFLFYGLHTEALDVEGRKKIYKEIYALCSIMLWLSFVINVLSLISLYSVGRSVSYYFGYLVVYENRFTGIYFNPNLMAFTSFCAMFCCHILWQGDFFEKTSGKPMTKLRRAIILISAGLNLAVIFLTDSNATMLIIVCYTIIYICYRLFGGHELKLGYTVGKTAALLALVVVIGAGVFVVRSVVQTSATQTISTPSESSNAFEDSDDELNKITFEHQNKNLDSGRIKLFKQGINVIKHHPILGVGKGEITKYGNRYNDNKMKYSDFHNGYLTVFVCAGAVGFFLFIAFAVCLGKRMVTDLFSVKPTIRSDIFPCLASFIAAYCVYAFFERTMIYDVTFMVEFFWLVLGYAAVCMVRYEGGSYKTAAFAAMIENKHTDDPENKTHFPINS